MKNYQEVIGIDVSKHTIDAYCHHRAVHKVFDNTVQGYRLLQKWVSKQVKKESFFYCFENTGNYSLKLATYLTSQGMVYVEESPIKIKRSSGLVREKSDKVDAKLIAKYGWLHREELTPSNLRSTSQLELGRLLGLRDQLVRSKAGLQGTLKELSNLLSSPSTDVSCEVLRSSIQNLSKQIQKIEQRLLSLVEAHSALWKNYQLLISLRGVGFVVACQLIYHTDNFTRFSNSRQFSSYCGLVPYEYSSGTSVHKRKQCHYLGDRKMKSLLSMCAISAIQHDPELKQYYQNKVAEGKPKMVALNNVRNKLLARAFSVVKRGTPYVILNQHVA